MTDNFCSLAAKIGRLTKKQIMIRRILLVLMPIILSLPLRVDKKGVSRYAQRIETTYRCCFKLVFDLVRFNSYNQLPLSLN
jgi:hypothetical protein